MIVGHVYVVRTTLTRPPKNKIVVCVSAEENLFFWFNTEARRHGIGQLLIAAHSHRALSRDCYLDLSRVTTFLPVELQIAEDRGPISQHLAFEIISAIKARIRTLAPRHAALAINNLSAF